MVANVCVNYPNLAFNLNFACIFRRECDIK